MDYNAREIHYNIHKDYDIENKIIDLGMPIEIEYSKDPINNIITDINKLNKPYFTDNTNYNEINNIDNLNYTLQSDALKGELETTNLSNLFFSEENVKIINDTIRYNVWKQTNRAIDNLSFENLSNIMKATFLNSADFLDCNIKEQINELNDRVIEYCTPIVINEVKSYIGYITDLSTGNNNRLMDRPKWMHKDNYTFDMTNIPT